MSTANQCADAPFPAGFVESVEQFLEADTAPPGLASYPAVFASELFYPLQRRRELEAMTRLVAESTRARTVMEIGADKGGGLYHWCQLPTVTRVIACEIRGTPYAAAFERRFPHIEFLWLPRSSRDMDSVRAVRTMLGDKGRLDALFVDGDKGAYYEDYRLYSPMVRTGGLVLMHDVGDPGPVDAWERLRRELPDRTSVIAIRDEWRGLDAADSTPYAGWLRNWKGTSCTVGVIRR